MLCDDLLCVSPCCVGVIVVVGLVVVVVGMVVVVVGVVVAVEGSVVEVVDGGVVVGPEPDNASGITK